MGGLTMARPNSGFSRAFSCLATALLLCAGAPADRIGPLFDALKSAPTEQQSEAIETKIALYWRSQITPAVQLLLEHASKAMTQPRATLFPGAVRFVPLRRVPQRHQARAGSLAEFLADRPKGAPRPGAAGGAAAQAFGRAFIETSMFFSEERRKPARREPKDFTFSAAPTIGAMTWMFPQA